MIGEPRIRTSAEVVDILLLQEKLRKLRVINLPFTIYKGFKSK